MKMCTYSLYLVEHSIGILIDYLIIGGFRYKSTTDPVLAIRKPHPDLEPG